MKTSHSFWKNFKPFYHRKSFLSAGLIFLGMMLMIGYAVMSAQQVPTEIEQPGTQPGEVATFTSPDNCDNCHDDSGDPDREDYPGFGWRGGLMANATRDPIFWGTLAIAEQDFIPNPDPNARGGAGDLCIRCHSVGGWLNQHSTPTDGSAITAQETDGIECEFCHLMVNPDQPTNVPGTTEVQNPPFIAYDETTGEPYYGTGQYVINGEGTRLGPYDENDANAKHNVYYSSFHRQGEFCGTCHDVSNPAVGDLAYNNGAMVPLEPGTFSGVVGGPIEDKAAFNNPPYKYGIVERTSSEWTASALDTFLVNDYLTLPADLRVPGGALDNAYHRAYDDLGDANYVNGDLRYFTCQTCHMYAETGLGCNKNGVPERTDLPRHDQTGSGYWMPDVIQYMDTKGTLLLGGGLDTTQNDALDAGQLRAQDMIQSAASINATQSGNDLEVTVTNLTAHKFISGYPEGRRAWINIQWRDSGGGLIREDGAYGQIGHTANDLDGTAHQVESLIDLYNTHVYEAEPGMDKEWADQLLSLGYDPNLALTYDRMTDLPVHTLQDLSNELTGSAYHTFHFVLNNVMVHDGRIPPYGFQYDQALTRSCLPVPDTQYGNPGAGGTFNYWDDVSFPIPADAALAEVRLYYQPTSWEYIQFLWLGNDGLSTFLGDEGINMLDGWLNNAQAPPLEVTSTTVSVTGPTVGGAPGEASHQNVPADQMLASLNHASHQIDITFTPACDATDHTIYYGALEDVSTYSYAGGICRIGADGLASFNPDLGNIFFLIVGSNDSVEGSYGKSYINQISQERPEATGIAPACDFPQDLAGVVCE